MATSFARLKNQYGFKHQTVFSARFDKQDEDNQVLDKTELFINLIIKQNLAYSVIGNIDSNYSLEDKIQKQEMNDW